MGDPMSTLIIEFFVLGKWVTSVPSFGYLPTRQGHSGCRTIITTPANKGVSVRLLASLVRHSNIATTQRYIDVNDDMKRRAVELI
jgi:hypothetical protein